MKTLSQILLLAVLALSSCTSTLYTGAEYDDLYYRSSDQPVATNKSSVNEQIAQGTKKGNEYYDNVYAADTLVSDQYSDAVDYNASDYNNEFNNNQGYEYYNDGSYTGRLRMFYGNYFDPYWRDPFYSNFGYGMGFGFGGYPYSYGFGNPYYGYGGGLYGDYYGGGYYPGYYGGYYPGYYGGYYGSYYGGFYGGIGSYYPYGYSGYNIHYKNTPYGRNERPSTMSSRWNNNVGGVGSGRRDTYLSGTNSRTGGRTSGTQYATDQRRTASTGLNSQQVITQPDRKSGSDQTKQGYTRSNNSAPRTSANARPEYNSANRSYTPSYNNPRMSTRPSYNNSRVTEGVNTGVSRNSSSSSSRIYNNAGSVRTPSNQGSYQNSYNNGRSNSSGNSGVRRNQSPTGYSAPAGQYRSNSYRSSGSYSVPSRSSVERSSGYSSGSYSGSSSGRSSYSGGSESRSSYSSGSSSSSSSSGRSSSGGGGGGSSSGRR